MMHVPDTVFPDIHPHPSGGEVATNANLNLIFTSLSHLPSWLSTPTSSGPHAGAFTTFGYPRVFMKYFWVSTQIMALQILDGQNIVGSNVNLISTRLSQDGAQS